MREDERKWALMSLKSLGKQMHDKPDIDAMVPEIRERMLQWHGKAGIKASLKEETARLLRGKYPHEIDSLEEYAEAIYQRLYGLGLLEKYLDDTAITDISIIGTQIMYKKEGRKIIADERFIDDSAVRVLQDRILALKNKSVTTAQPSQDTELYDGSRALIVIPPQSERPVIIIRKHNMLSVPLKALADKIDGLTGMLEYFKHAVRERKNIVVVGETGAGKTTFINALGFEIQEKHVVAVLEDTREIKLPLSFVYYFKIREAAGEAREISYSDILKDCLRADPDRIILTEIRSPVAAYEFIHVLNSGHRGSMTTIHANSCLDALFRLELLISEHRDIEKQTVRRLISRAVDVIVNLRLESDEKGDTAGRKLAEVYEILDTDGGDYILQEVAVIC